MDKGQIISLDGGATWITPNYPGSLQITRVEGEKIAYAMKNSDFTDLQANGIFLEGVKYQFLREDSKVCFAKRKEYGSITIQKSKSAVVIGRTPEGKIQGNSNKAVGVIADYLESIGM